jgi:hypothetical protein
MSLCHLVVPRCFCNIRWSIPIDFCALSSNPSNFLEKIQDGGDILIGSENYFLLSMMVTMVTQVRELKHCMNNE